MKTILVPTDFSKNADDALNYAIALAKEIKAKIILLNVWEINYPGTDMPVPGEFISEQIHSAEMNAIAHMKPLCYRATSADVLCDQINKQGFVIDTILETIENQEIDLVIMGTKGATGLKEILIGSNTAKVIQKATCPVIAVPGGATFKGLKRITYATNYQSSDFNVLKKLVEIARFFGSEITLLHISDENYAEEGAKTILKLFSERVIDKVNYGHITFRLVYGADVEEKLDEFVRHKQTDLLVMSAMYRNLFDRLFGKSYTKKLVYHTRIPLMAFHHTENAVVFI